MRKQIWSDEKRRYELAPQPWYWNLADWTVAHLTAIICALFVVSIVGMMVASSMSETRSVPKESCSSAPTGNVHETTSLQCFGYDDKSNCTLWAPVTTTWYEYQTSCVFKEWK